MFEYVLLCLADYIGNNSDCKEIRRGRELRVAEMIDYVMCPRSLIGLYEAQDQLIRIF